MSKINNGNDYNNELNQQEKPLGTKIADNTRAATEYTKEKLSDAYDSTKETLQDLTGQTHAERARSHGDRVKARGQDAIDAAKESGSAAADAGKEAVEYVKERGRDAADRARERLPEGERLSERNIRDDFRNDQVYEANRESEGLGAKISDAFESVKEKLGFSHEEQAKDRGQDALDYAKDSGNSALEAVKHGGHAAKEKVRDTADSFRHRVHDNQRDNVQNPALYDDQNTEGLGAKISDAFESVKEKLGFSHEEQAKDRGQDALDYAKDSGNSALEAVKHGGHAAKEKARDTFEHVKESGRDAAESVRHRLHDNQRDSVQHPQLYDDQNPEGFGTKIAGAFESVKEKFGISHEQQAKDRGQDALDYSKDSGNSAADAIKHGGQAAKEKAQDAVDYTKERGKEAADAVRERLPSRNVDQYNDERYVTNEQNAGLGTKIAGGIADAFGSVKQSLGFTHEHEARERGQDALDAAKDSGSAAVDAVKHGGQAAKAKAQEAVDYTKQRSTEVARDVKERLPEEQYDVNPEDRGLGAQIADGLSGALHSVKENLGLTHDQNQPKSWDPVGVPVENDGKIRYYRAADGNEVVPSENIEELLPSERAKLQDPSAQEFHPQTTEEALDKAVAEAPDEPSEIQRGPFDIFMLRKRDWN